MRIFERLKEEVTVRQSARRILAAKNAETERYETLEAARELKTKGYSNAFIGRELGHSEGTVRRMLRENGA